LRTVRPSPRKLVSGDDSPLHCQVWIVTTRRHPIEGRSVCEIGTNSRFLPRTWSSPINSSMGLNFQETLGNVRKDLAVGIHAAPNFLDYSISNCTIELSIMNNCQRRSWISLALPLRRDPKRKSHRISVSFSKYFLCDGHITFNPRSPGRAWLRAMLSVRGDSTSTVLQVYIYNVILDQISWIWLNEVITGERWRNCDKWHKNEIDKFKVYESLIIMFMRGWIDDIVCISSRQIRNG
jgi:hypothetical protein